MLHGNEAVRVRARVRVFPRASCGVLPARAIFPILGVKAAFRRYKAAVLHLI